MARIKNYIKDSNITNDDLLVGSSYEGQGQSGAVYRTRNYRLDDLASYFSRNFDLDGVNYDLSQLAVDINDNSIAIASANQSITTIANDQLAQATFQTNLAATFGTFNDQGVLQSLSQSFADQVLQTTASDRYANAQFVTNLATSVGTFDANGNLVTLAESFANQVISTTTSDTFATSQFVTNLASSIGTVDANGNLTVSEAFANSVLQTETTTDYATSEFVTNLGSSFGTVGTDGTVTISEAFANEVFSTTTSSEYATASQFTELQTQVSNIPVTIRQDDEPAIYDAQNNLINPLGSIWVDTNDSNALYILTEDVNQTPSVFWQATSSEALGDLIQSTADLQQTVNTLSTDQSALATKTDTLTAQFGTYDPATDTFTFSATSNYFGEVKTYADTESASAQKLDQLESAIGTLDAQGNLTLTEAFANQVLNTETTTDYAEASFVTNLASSLGTTDANGNLTVSEAFANSVLNTETTTDYADATFVTNLAASLGTTDAQGNLTISEAFANQVLNTETTTDYAEASFVTNLASSLGTTDANGNLTVSEAFANSVMNTENTTDYAESSFVTNLASSLGTTDADGNLTISEAFANSIMNTETTTDYASAQSVTDLGVTVGNNSATISTQADTIADLEGHAEANYSIAVDVNGNVAGMKLLADTTTSEIAFTADTFKIYNGTGTTAAFTLDGSALKLNVPLNGVSGSFSGDISAATGTFTGGLNINNRFLVNSSGSTTIKAGDTSSRFEIQNDSGGSKYRLFGHKINFNSWSGGTNFDDSSNQLSPGFLQFGGVAYMYSGNGTTTTTNHHMTLDVYGGSKKLFLKADQITLRKSTTTGGSHTTIIEGDLEVQGNVSFTSSSSHPDTSSVSDSNNTGQTFIQNLDFDGYGHVLSYTTGTVSTDTPAIYADGSGNPQLTTGVTEAEVRSLIGAGTSSFSGDYDDLTNKPTVYAEPGIFSGGGTPTLATGVTAAEVRTLISAASSSHNHDTRYLRKDQSDTMDGTFTATGDIIAYGTSDRRLKENIKTITNPIEKVKSIGGYEFDWNNKQDTYQGHDIGVVAQEIEEILPEIVSTRSNGYKAVKYDRIVALLIEAVKEQQNQIEELKSIINGGTN